MAEFRPSALLKDPTLAPVAGLRVAAAHGDAAIDERRLLRDLMDFDAHGRSSLASLDQLIESSEFAAAEELLETLLRMTEHGAELRARESRLAAARSESLREATEQVRLEIERARAGGADVAPAIVHAAAEAVDTARRSRDAAAEQIGALRKLVEQHVASRRDALRVRVEALEAQAPRTDRLTRARAALDRGHLDIVQGLLDEDTQNSDESLTALTAPRSKPWIESTSLPDALQWLVTGLAPPGFLERWRPAEGDTEAWEVANALCALLEIWPPRPDTFHRFLVSVERLLGGKGDVEPPVATEGALSARLPALRLSDAPWFRPANHPGGLLIVLPAVSGAGVPAGVGPEELVLTLRLREALQTDRRAIRVEGAQLIPLLSDPYRRVNVWRLVGARTPLSLALVPLEGLLKSREDTHWMADPSRVRHFARVTIDFLALDAVPVLVDGIVQISGGVPVLGLVLLEALLNVVQDRTTGRTGVVDMDDLRTAFWHDLYLPRVWSVCLGSLDGDREALATLAAVRCACGSQTEARFTLSLEEVFEWATMAGLEEAATRTALDRLRALGLFELSKGDHGEVVVGQHAGLALVAARKQGPPDEVLSIAAQELLPKLRHDAAPSDNDPLSDRPYS